MQLVGDDIGNLIQPLDYNSACAVGCDFGGGVAWNLAIRVGSISGKVFIDVDCSSRARTRLIPCCSTCTEACRTIS